MVVYLEDSKWLQQKCPRPGEKKGPNWMKVGDTELKTGCYTKTRQPRKTNRRENLSGSKGEPIVKITKDTGVTKTLENHEQKKGGT